jgi:hypothetical protein
MKLERSRDTPTLSAILATEAPLEWRTDPAASFPLRWRGGRKASQG